MLDGITRIVSDFAKTVAKGDPLAFYDTKELPHPKDLIEHSVLIAIKFENSKECIAGARVMLEALTQYQDGVGPTPATLVPVLDGLPPEQIAAAIVAHDEAGGRARWEWFSRLAERDRRRHAQGLWAVG
jgi:hypothetical protein